MSKKNAKPSEKEISILKKEYINYIFLFFVLIWLCIPIAIIQFSKTDQTVKTGQNLEGIHKIKHIIIIIQENRSFDDYFGTFPGALGIPMKDGIPTVCIPDPKTKTCIKPFHDTSNVDFGGAHDNTAGVLDINNGKMDGFIATQQSAVDLLCQNRTSDYCESVENSIDVVGYHNGKDIPNYWSYAKNFVLQDKLFESVNSTTLPSHLYALSAWAAQCPKEDDPQSCVNDINITDSATDYAWTDITYLLHKYNVSWSYYIDQGIEPDCEDGAIFCGQTNPLKVNIPGMWNPLPKFTTVKEDNQLSNIKDISHLYNDLQKNNLPSVSWVIPNDTDSEHPPEKITNGQSYVTNIVNSVMKSKEWDSSAIFIAWDDWGGFYDNVVPPKIDQNGFGMRVPGILISPYAKKGYIDNQTLSFDAYLKFIEDDFLNGQRIDPNTDGRADPRPDVRENNPILGNLSNEFDFNQAPRNNLILSTNPKTDLH